MRSFIKFTSSVTIHHPGARAKKNYSSFPCSTLHVQSFNDHASTHTSQPFPCARPKSSPAAKKLHRRGAPRFASVIQCLWSKSEAKARILALWCSRNRSQYSRIQALEVTLLLVLLQSWNHQEPLPLKHPPETKVLLTQQWTLMTRP